MPSLCHITAILVVLVGVTLPLLSQLLPPDKVSFSLDESVANDGTTRNVIVTGANSGLGLVRKKIGTIRKQLGSHTWYSLSIAVVSSTPNHLSSFDRLRSSTWRNSKTSTL
jgi:hypothetical protein